jgi:hypothetical protein
MLGQRKISSTIVMPGPANSNFREVSSKKNLSGSFTQVVVLSLNLSFSAMLLIIREDVWSQLVCTGIRIRDWG